MAAPPKINLPNEARNMRNKLEVQFSEPGNPQEDPPASKPVNRHRFLKQVTGFGMIPVLALAFAAQLLPSIYAQEVDEHAVFVMTNSGEGNEIIAYSRAADGSLVERNHYATGGRGSGGTIDPLGAQGSLTLSADHSLLFAVNAGTGDLSVFRVRGANLDLAQVVCIRLAVPECLTPSLLGSKVTRLEISAE
jgi:hypothetical protein